MGHHISIHVGQINQFLQYSTVVIHGIQLKMEPKHNPIGRNTCLRLPILITACTITLHHFNALTQTYFTYKWIFESVKTRVKFFCLEGGGEGECWYLQLYFFEVWYLNLYKCKYIKINIGITVVKFPLWVLELMDESLNSTDYSDGMSTLHYYIQLNILINQHNIY
jgi:hypothetical protein